MAELAHEIRQAVATLLRELIDGAASENTWVLNREDPGLLQSLGKLSAEEASAVVREGASSIAAHVDHLRYGLELANRWSNGENPYKDANYAASWQRLAVSDREWVELQKQLSDQAHKWLDAAWKPDDISEIELTGILASVVHLAYHVGAIRQMNRSTRGPAAND